MTVRGVRVIWSAALGGGLFFIIGGAMAAGAKGTAGGGIATVFVLGAAFFATVRRRTGTSAATPEADGDRGTRRQGAGPKAIESAPTDWDARASTVDQATPSAPAPAPAPKTTADSPAGRPPRPDVSEQIRVRTPLFGKRSELFARPWQLPASTLAQPALAADEARIGGLEVRAASVSGPSHRSEGVARQDAYCLTRDRRGRFLIAAVADGMSDSAHSDLGAQVAVRTACNRLTESLDGETPLDQIDAGDVFLAAARQMNAVAQQRGWSGNDVRAILGVAVIPTRPDGDGRRTAWLATLGDLAVWQAGPDGWDKLLGDDKTGLDAGRLADYLPHTPEAVRMMTATLGRDTVLTLATDGMGDAFTGLTGAGATFAHWWRQPVTALQLLVDISFEARQHGDDRTAVAIWCRDDVSALP